MEKLKLHLEQTEATCAITYFQTKTKMSKEKKRSFFEEIEQGKNRFTLDDPMGKLVKSFFDLTQLAKKLKQNKDDE